MLWALQGLKVTEAKPGQWVVVSGIGGLGHLAVQYAVAMGLHVAAVDVDDAKLELARRVGARVAVNAASTDPVAAINEEIGGGHAALVTATSLQAAEQAMGMVRRGGTVVLVGLPVGTIPLSIFATVSAGITVRGSIVGTRMDLREALRLAGEGGGRIRATVTSDRLENVNAILERLAKGQVEGRVSMDLR